MSWKSLLTAGFAACVLSSSVMAAPSILAKPRPYSAASGGIQWEIFVTQNDPAYTGALSVELPLTLTAHNGPAFVRFLNGSGGDDTNGAAGNTWYYNETADASGTLLWNITDPANAADHTQNNGANPFTATNTAGLYIDTAGQRVFAALGSTVGMADALTNAVNPEAAGKQVRVLRVLTSDGILNWTNAIVGENGVQYTGISGSASSIAAGDTNGNGTMNPGTGAFTDPTSFADIPDFQTLLTGAPGVASYNAAHPGLNGNKRGDMNGNGTTNFGDIPGFQAALANPNAGAGSGLGGGSSVPEPTSLVLLMIGGLSACALRRRTK